MYKIKCEKVNSRKLASLKPKQNKTEVTVTGQQWLLHSYLSLQGKEIGQRGTNDYYFLQCVAWEIMEYFN